MEKLRTWAKKEWQETSILFHSIPSVTVVLFAVSVVAMNLMANKTIVSVNDAAGNQVFALDGGFTVSWISFLCMDIITKRFGPKASTKVSILAIGINVLTCLMFWLVSIIPTDKSLGDFSAIDSVLGGTWFVLLSSTIAFIISAIINNFTNDALGKAFHKNPNGKLAYVTRTYISTMIGQFLDNLIFSILTFMVFAPKYWGFKWTFLACITCALTGAVAELIMEIIFSPIGFNVCKKWEAKGIGNEYISYCLKEKDI